jgi:hypothetical protein
MGNLYEKFIKKVPSLVIHSTLSIEKAKDRTMPLSSQDWAKSGEMLKLIVKSQNQWKIKGFMSRTMKVLQAYI